MTPAWVALVEILLRLESEPCHWPVGRIIFQKIAYVATREGLPTGLKYPRVSFGPYSAKLKGVVTRLVNNNLLREEHQGSMFRVSVGPNYARVRRDYEAALAPWDGIMAKTADLFRRLDTNQAEIAAAVLFAADGLRKAGGETPSESDVLAEVMEWKQRRRPPLNTGEVVSAIRNLGMLRWLDLRYDPNLPLPTEELL